MSLHNKPEYNSPAIHAAIKRQNLPTETPSMSADFVRLGWFEAMHYFNIKPTHTSEASDK